MVHCYTYNKLQSNSNQTKFGSPSGFLNLIQIVTKKTAIRNNLIDLGEKQRRERNKILYKENKKINELKNTFNSFFKKCIEKTEKEERLKLVKKKNNKYYKLEKEFNFFFLNDIEKKELTNRDKIKIEEIFNFYLINKQIKHFKNISNGSLSSIQQEEFIQRCKIMKYKTTYFCKLKRDFKNKLNFN